MLCYLAYIQSLFFRQEMRGWSFQVFESKILDSHLPRVKIQYNEIHLWGFKEANSKIPFL